MFIIISIYSHLLVHYTEMHRILFRKTLFHRNRSLSLSLSCLPYTYFNGKYSKFNGCFTTALPFWNLNGTPRMPSTKLQILSQTDTVAEAQLKMQFIRLHN